MTRARYPDVEGDAWNHDVKIHYEVYGEGEPTIFLLPSWAIVYARAWKAQIPYLSRHFRVVACDGRGNGKSDRPIGAEQYGWDHQVADAIAVMDATKTDTAVVMGVSNGGHLAALLAARHPARVLGAVLIAASPPTIGPNFLHWQNFGQRRDSYEGWGKCNKHYWRHNYRDFVEFFWSKIYPEPHSTKQIEDSLAWSLETTPETLIDTVISGGDPGGEEVYRGIACPALLIHGDQDLSIPLEMSRYLAELCGGRLVVLPGSGHVPNGRIPAKVNLILKDFVDEIAGKSVNKPQRIAKSGRPKRALYLSSPIGLGHGRRDLAIARELRRHHPDLAIHWLAQHPVTALLERAGETIHPGSELLANESGHIEAEADGHDLHVFEAIRRMDEILVANFMAFQEIVTEADYDLVIADEAWEVDHFWHEHPELKRASLAWFTDFVGYLPMPEKGERDEFLTADYNAEMLTHVEDHPTVRDRAIFVGDPEDCVERPLGPGMPGIKDWTARHFDFCGYITGFDPRDFGPRELLRAELGYRADEKICIVTVGGSGVGRPLLQRVLAAYTMARRTIPELRMIAVAGPRIDPAALGAAPGVELRAFVPDLPRHLAACDLAIVQGGLTTCMELTASRTPFIYVPIRNHFEQNFHVHHRLQRYRAGRRMDYTGCDPDALTAAIVEELGRNPDYAPVATDGAARAAGMIAALL